MSLRRKVSLIHLGISCIILFFGLIGIFNEGAGILLMILQFPIGIFAFYGTTAHTPPTYSEHVIDITFIVLNSLFWGYFWELCSKKSRSK